MAHDLEVIKAQVTKEPTVAGSVLTLCHGVASGIVAAKDNPAALDALADDLNAAAALLADLIKGKLTEPPGPPGRPYTEAVGKSTK